jgi:hypothetical protein
VISCTRAGYCAAGLKRRLCCISQAVLTEQEQDDAPTPPYYAYFDLQATAPITPGLYTLTVRSTLNNGAILMQQDLAYPVVP